MMKINKKAVVGLLLAALILISPAFVGVNFAQPPTVIYVDPQSLAIEVCTNFTMDIKVRDVYDLYNFTFWLGYDTNLLDAIDVVLGPFLNSPNHAVVKKIDDTAGVINFAATSDPPAQPATGNGILASITFHCTGSGKTLLHLYSTSLFDFLGVAILHATMDGTVTQIPPWFVKPAFTDYAPNGMPDFDQKQDNWVSPMVGWTWCGPVAVANSLWWLDSEYESLLNPAPVPPPTYSDKFALVHPYGSWDDHDVKNVEPFVSRLGFLMDTDGGRTNISHSGTFFNDVQAGLSQYLQMQGVNPPGDCDGDGDVDFADWLIVQKAFNATPTSPNWNMAADVYQNNIVDSFDQLVVESHFGQVGMFCEHTEEFPAFPWIVEEVYACEDMVLLLELWQDMGGGNWVRYTYEPGGQGGHYVTLAGFNSTNSQLLISDPWWDAFEAKKAPGESPAPHAYPHSSDLHNDTRFVSHDAYVAMQWMLPQPSPYPSPVWELMGYLQALGWDPSWHAFMRAAVVTSPITVAVLNAKNSKEPCNPYPTVGRPINRSIDRDYTANITATITNKGSVQETFVATAYANGIAINSSAPITLLPNATVNIGVATWNTTDWAYGDYFITVGTSVSYQSFTSGNITIGFAIRVTIPGDINGDWTVDIYDALILAGHFNEHLPWPHPTIDPNADINGDGVVDIYDAILLAKHLNKTIPPPPPLDP